MVVDPVVRSYGLLSVAGGGYVGKDVDELSSRGWWLASEPQYLAEMFALRPSIQCASGGFWERT